MFSTHRHTLCVFISVYCIHIGCGDHSALIRNSRVMGKVWSLQLMAPVRGDQQSGQNAFFLSPRIPLRRCFFLFNNRIKISYIVHFCRSLAFGTWGLRQLETLVSINQVFIGCVRRGSLLLSAEMAF